MALSHMSKGFEAPKLVDTYNEYANGLGDISVVGSLAKRINYWKHINASDDILRIVEKGYTIPLYTLPPKRVLRNNKSNRTEPEFVQQTIDELLVKGVVAEVNTVPWVVNPLTVSVKNHKKRLVLDLRHVNKRVYLKKSKIENHDTFIQYLPGAKFLFGFDLKSGYHHVSINPLQHTLLGFSYPDYKGKIRYFTFLVMPFGLNSAGFIFTTLLKVLVKHWGSQLIRIVVFFDDGMGAGTTWEETLLHSNVVRTSLILAGWVPNVTKSHWLPASVLGRLGFCHNLITGYVTVANEKIDLTIQNMLGMLKKRRVHVRALASISGSIIALHNAYGDIVYMKMKHMVRMIGLNDDWGRHVTITKEIRKELTFWTQYLPSHNGMPIPMPMAAGVITYSDASQTGCAAVISPCPDRQKVIVQREFSPQEAKTSSTYRELITVYTGIKNATSILQNNVVRWNTDSKNIISIVRKGSMKLPLHNIAMKIFQLTRKHNIQLSMTWLRRCYNKEADYFSRVIDYDDWGVHPKWFAHICKNFGVMAVDRFADPWNAKCSRFNSRFYWEEAEAVDAFTQDWGKMKIGSARQFT